MAAIFWGLGSLGPCWGGSAERCGGARLPTSLHATSLLARLGAGHCGVVDVWEGFESKRDTDTGDCLCPVTQAHCPYLPSVITPAWRRAARVAAGMHPAAAPPLTQRPASSICRRDEGELSQLQSCRVSQPTAALVKGNRPVAGWGQAPLKACLHIFGLVPLQCVVWGDGVKECHLTSLSGSSAVQRAPRALTAPRSRALTDRTQVRGPEQRSNGTAKATQQDHGCARTGIQVL